MAFLQLGPDAAVNAAQVRRLYVAPSARDTSKWAVWSSLVDVLGSEELDELYDTQALARTGLLGLVNRL